MRVSASLLVVAACAQPPEEPQRELPQLPEPIVPSAFASSGPEAELAWLEQLPKTKLEAHAGERVWAAVPLASGLCELGVFTIDQASANDAALVDRTGQRRKRVPAALVHRLGDGRRLAVGDTALVNLWTLPATLARVSALKNGRVSHVHYDWLGRTKEGEVEHAEVPPAGTAPLATVGYRKLGNLSKGLIVASDDTRAWVLTGSGQVEVHPRAELTALELRPRSYGAGQRVRAYRWATGFVLGSVAAELEPNVRYRVKLTGDPKEAPLEYFFTDLVPDKVK